MRYEERRCSLGGLLVGRNPKEDAPPVRAISKSVFMCVLLCVLDYTRGGHLACFAG